LLSEFGVVAAGPAFTIAYIIHFAVLNVLVRRNSGFRWQPLSLWLLAMNAGLGAGLLVLAMSGPLAAALAAPILALGTGLFGLRVVLIKIGPKGRLAARLARLYAAIGWPIRSST
jgi:PST family polysaccharide transporter